MAVAINVASVAENPMLAANDLPCCRATTMSASERMATTISCSTGIRLNFAGCPLLQVRETLLQIERGGHTLHGQAQLHHRKGHFRLDAHDDRIRAAQTYHVGDVSNRARRKGIHHIERRHVDDHALRAELDHFVDERPAQMEQIRIRESSLDGGYEKRPLL